MLSTPPSDTALGFGRRAEFKVPLEILLAEVVSVVADAANPLIFPAAILLTETSVRFAPALSATVNSLPKLTVGCCVTGSRISN